MTRVTRLERRGEGTLGSTQHELAWGGVSCVPDAPHAVCWCGSERSGAARTQRVDVWRCMAGRVVTGLERGFCEL